MPVSPIHLQAVEIRSGESYDKVLMHWDGQQYVEPHWKASTREEVERLIGRRLEE